MTLIQISTLTYSITEGSKWDEWLEAQESGLYMYLDGEDYMMSDNARYTIEQILSGDFPDDEPELAESDIITGSEDDRDALLETGRWALGKPESSGEYKLNYIDEYHR